MAIRVRTRAVAARVKTLAIGFSLAKPEVDPEPHIAMRNHAGKEVSTVPVYSTPSEEYPAK
jgi:hypothetical protein